jgi:hypothetical protein
MITLQEVFDGLAHGELSQLSMGNSDLETITEKSYPRVVSAVNLALVEIFKRLNLRQNTLDLHQHADLTTYYLRSDYAEEADYMDEDYYIAQTDAQPFEDDVLKILNAVDAAGNKVHINDSRYPADIFTPQFDAVKIAGPSTTITNYDGKTRTILDVFTINYQAKYPKIKVTQTFKPDQIKLQIPDSIFEPLLIYIAHRLTKRPTKLVKGEKSPNHTLLIEFENAIKRVELLGLDIEPDNERDQFTANGWI